MEKNPNSKKKQPDESGKAYSKYFGMVFQMGIVIAIGVWGGIKLDEFFKFDTPVFTIVLSLLSVFAAIYLALKDFIKKE